MLQEIVVGETCCFPPNISAGLGLAFIEKVLQNLEAYL